MLEEGAWLYVWLGLAAIAAGCVNSIAGGGTLLTFPALLSALNPLGASAAVVANGTSTVALVTGSISGAWGFRRDLHTVRSWIPLLIIPSLVGGYVGSRLVTQLDPKIFDALVPWLVLTAAILFLIQPFLAKQASATHKERGPAIIALLLGAQFLVAIYGGYFGAGIGILMLSALGLMGLSDIYAMNGLKNILAACINGVAVLVFAFDKVVEWRYVAVMAPAAVVGAYGGSLLAKRIDRRIVRLIVIAIGFGLAAYYFYKRWHN
jgi:uncharacterized membrane protein YfcA